MRKKALAIPIIVSLIAGSLLPAAVSASDLTPYGLYPSFMAASSKLAASSYGNYYPENLMDNNPSTAWVEGVSGNGEGEYVDYFFPAGTVITGGLILNGYHKSEDLFWKNAAPVSLDFQSGSVVKTIDFTQQASAMDYSYAGTDFYFDEPIVCDGTFRVTIHSVRGGSKYTDTCISELHFYGYEAGTYEYGHNAGGDAHEDTDFVNNIDYGYFYDDGSEYVACSDGSYRIFGDEREWLELLVNNWEYGYQYEFSSIAKYAMEETEPNSWESITESIVTADALSDETKAFLFYWYQYHCADSRIDRSDMLKNAITKDEVYAILDEILGNASDSTVSVTLSKYAMSYDTPSDTAYFGSTGDFGAVGDWYFSEPLYLGIENGRLKIAGEVIFSDGSPITLTYAAYFTYHGGEALNGWQFDSAAVGESMIQQLSDQGAALYQNYLSGGGQQENSGVNVSGNVEESPEPEETQGGFSEAELADLARAYYERHYNYTPQEIETSVQSDGKVLLHLYNIVTDHTATLAWYLVDSSGVGEDYMLGDPVDLNN